MELYNMKIFLDTGDVEAIRKANDTGLVDGVTTNPSHIAKTGGKFQNVVKEICSIVTGPVSAEAVAEDTDELIAAAEDIAAIASNVVIKIPMTPQGLKAVPVLEKQKGIKTNVTTNRRQLTACCVPDGLDFDLGSVSFAMVRWGLVMFQVRCVAA